MIVLSFPPLALRVSALSSGFGACLMDEGRFILFASTVMDSVNSYCDSEQDIIWPQLELEA